MALVEPAFRQFTKAYNRPFTINSECLEGIQGHWFINGVMAPSTWVQSNNDLLLPASDWSTYGNISHLCGSITNIYEVYSLGMFGTYSLTSRVDNSGEPLHYY